MSFEIPWGTIIIDTIKMLWPLFGPLLIIMVILVLARSFFERSIKNIKNTIRFLRGRHYRSDRELLYWLRGMKPWEFEEYITTLFQKLGFRTQRTGGPHDRGVDVVAEKDGIKHYIQCKKFITSTVSVSDVRDFYGSITDHLATGKGYFITTNKFTLEAEKFCEDKPIELIDGFKLLKYIRLVDKNNQRIEISQNNNFESEQCPQCGSGKLILRNGRYGNFYGCSNYPECKFVKKI